MRLPKSTIQKYALPPEKECISANVGGKFLSKVIATVYVAFIFINLSILFKKVRTK